MELFSEGQMSQLPWQLSAINSCILGFGLALPLTDGILCTHAYTCQAHPSTCKHISFMGVDMKRRRDWKNVKTLVISLTLIVACFFFFPIQCGLIQSGLVVCLLLLYGHSHVTLYGLYFKGIRSFAFHMCKQRWQEMSSHVALLLTCSRI